MCDIEILNWLHNNTIPHSIPVLQFISYTTTYISILMALVVLIISFVRRSKEIRKKFYVLASVLLLVALVSNGLKSLIFRERPFVALPNIEKLSEAGSSSFPSGHTLEAFAMATALSLLFRKRKIVIPVWTWAVIVAYSRMALGVHYPTDVLGGILIGVFIGWIVPWFFRSYVNTENTGRQDHQQ